MYGLRFPSAAVRLEQLDEAIRVCKSLWTMERSDFVGKHYTLTGAVCEPKPVQKPHPPIWVGGMGEKKTLRIVAEHADGWNAFPLPIPQMREKLDVLRDHCAAVGRDFDSIGKQLGIRAIVRKDPNEVEAQLAHFAQQSRLPRHIHAHWPESSYVLEGELSVIGGDARFEVRTGSFVFMPCGACARLVALRSRTLIRTVVGDPAIGPALHPRDRCHAVQLRN